MCINFYMRPLNFGYLPQFYVLMEQCACFFNSILDRTGLRRCCKGFSFIGSTSLDDIFNDLIAKLNKLRCFSNEIGFRIKLSCVAGLAGSGVSYAGSYKPFLGFAAFTGAGSFDAASADDLLRTLNIALDRKSVV